MIRFKIYYKNNSGVDGSADINEKALSTTLKLLIDLNVTIDHVEYYKIIEPKRGVIYG